MKIDDIPSYYQDRQKVIDWEQKFWQKPVTNVLFKADIDTTFALYREHAVKQQWGKTLRTAGKYQARHLPWYENPEILSEDEVFYRNQTIGSAWYTKNE